MPEELSLLTEWKKRLGLQDWYITLISHCDPKDMEPESDGVVEYAETLKAATVKIIDPKLRAESFRAFDFEETLVHELLHLKFCLLEEGSDWETDLQLRVLHQIIDDLARTMVTIKREQEK